MRSSSPGDRLEEVELAEKSEVSRSPCPRSATCARKRGHGRYGAPYKGANETYGRSLDIAELRLALITLAAKPAHQHLSPA